MSHPGMSASLTNTESDKACFLGETAHILLFSGIPRELVGTVSLGLPVRNSELEDKGCQSGQQQRTSARPRPWPSDLVLLSVGLRQLQAVSVVWPRFRADIMLPVSATRPSIVSQRSQETQNESKRCNSPEPTLRRGPSHNDILVGNLSFSRMVSLVPFSQ